MADINKKVRVSFDLDIEILKRSNGEIWAYLKGEDDACRGESDDIAIKNLVTELLQDELFTSEGIDNNFIKIEDIENE